jgi:hypothetical protein
MKPPALERNPAQAELAFALTVGQRFPEALLNERGHGGAFLRSDFTRFIEKRVRYIYSCFHMYVCIKIDIGMST